MSRLIGDFCDRRNTHAGCGVQARDKTRVEEEEEGGMSEVERGDEGERYRNWVR